MNLSDWIASCSEQMESAGLWFGHGTDNADDESAWLVLAALGLDPNEPVSPERPINHAEASLIRQLLQRRIESRKPLAYLLGEAWFCGLKFAINENVLVPRSPIAELIHNRFSPWIDPEKVHQVLDLCTGSACIAIACAVHLPQCKVDASDISLKALEVARRNIRWHGLDERVRLWQADLFDGLPDRTWDLVVTNPPYVARESMISLPAEYQAEPEMALVSAGKGLEIPIRILADAASHLSENGVLICEVGESAESLQKALPGVPLTWIEFEQGGEGVFTIDRTGLLGHREEIAAFQEQLTHV